MKDDFLIFWEWLHLMKSFPKNGMTFGNDFINPSQDYLAQWIHFPTDGKAPPGGGMKSSWEAEASDLKSSNAHCEQQVAFSSEPPHFQCWLGSHLHSSWLLLKSVGEGIGIWNLWQQSLWLTCPNGKWWNCWQESLFIRKERKQFPYAVISHTDVSPWHMCIRLPPRWYENICSRYIQ